MFSHSFGVLVLNILLSTVTAHSQMTEPQSTSPTLCRQGGDPQFGTDNCDGPCDMRAIEGGYANFRSPDNPAAVYERGQTVTIKYQRNNHGPGGFNRLTLVKPEDMMNKDIHKQNAFYYSCWGARAVAAEGAELEKDKFGFNFIGTDGEQHDHPVGYYVTEVKIPEVIPDGQYVLGWAWYGGTGGDILGMEPQEPKDHGYFGDYWSCSYIEIKGGVPLQSEYEPVFDNDMSQFSEEGCMSGNDDTGVCTFEPCTDVKGSYQMPKPFKEGAPPTLKATQFGGDVTEDVNELPAEPPAATPAPLVESVTPKSDNSNDSATAEIACLCIANGSGCLAPLAGLTSGFCEYSTHAHEQPPACKDSCCAWCVSPPSSAFLCQMENVIRECGL